MTELRKELNQKIKEKRTKMRDRQYIGQMKTKAILYYLLRRHADGIICILLSLAIGLFLGSRI